MCIQTTGWFVCQNNCRIVNQSPRYRYPLFLTSRQFIRFMRSPVNQSHEIQNLHGTVICLFGRNACNEGGNHHIFQCRKLRQQLMKLENKTDILITERR